MPDSQVHVLGDTGPAMWLARQLPDDDVRTGDVRVGDLLPAGFGAYARVLHPFEDSDQPRTWAEIARQNGRDVHALDDWSDLGASSGGAPVQGSLPLEQLAALCDILGAHTDTPDECIFALWEGWPGWRPLTPPPMLAARAGAPLDISHAPRVRFGGREHVLVSGRLSETVALSYSDRPGRWWAQSPTGFWPADRRWCVITHPARTCTLVAGSVALVEDVLAASGLEAWPVGPDDKLPEAGRKRPDPASGSLS
jgi:hypothetical protein